MAYYFAQLKNTSRVEVFYSRVTPTEKTHGVLYGYCFGPYKDKKTAIIKAQYQYTYGNWPIQVYCVDNRKKSTAADRNIARILGY